MIKKLLIFLFLIGAGSFSIQAQLLTYNGLGRSIIQDDNFKGNLIDQDTVSPSSGTGGYILFDMGINIHPSPVLKASAILRSRMEFGGFFGDGASLEFRQFNISGIVGKGNKGLKYELGDLDLKLSPFTLFNNEESYHEFESDIFEQRREIVAYENFNFGNKWRLQGINLNGNLLFEKGIERTDLQIFGTRQKNSINFEEPDRYLFGGVLKITQSKNLSLNINGTHYTDATSTINAPANKYQNTVTSGELRYTGKKLGKTIEIMAEAGFSNFQYSDIALEKSNDLNDVFSHIKATGKLDSLNLSLSLGYRYVGFDFYSTGAQTRRINDNGIPSVFGAIRQEMDFRVPSIFDRYSQEALYNQSLSPTLASYNPRYNLVSPYGLATPNRSGFSVNIEDLEKSEWIKYQINLHYLNEIVGEGLLNKRTFTSLTGGTKIKFNELLNTEKGIHLLAGARHETSNRADDLVNFTVLALDAGIDVEVFKHLFVQIGFKNINSSGQEYIGVRNNFNELTTYQAYNSVEANANINEQVLSSGVRFNFGKYSTFLFNAHFANVSNKNLTEGNYQIHEYFFGYTLKF